MFCLAKVIHIRIIRRRKQKINAYNENVYIKREECFIYIFIRKYVFIKTYLIRNMSQTLLGKMSDMV